MPTKRDIDLWKHIFGTKNFQGYQTVAITGDKRQNGAANTNIKQQDNTTERKTNHRTKTRQIDRQPPSISSSFNPSAVVCNSSIDLLAKCDVWSAMTALRLYGRTWKIADDDFVIPELLEGVLRIIWLVFCVKFCWWFLWV